MTTDDPLVHAARAGDAERLRALLDAVPDARDLRVPPHGWTLLHVAAQHGHLAVVDLLLARGLDPNAREAGDDTYAMHWAAAGGHLDVVRRLADAGGDVVGAGDDHALDVIGWATCWDGCDDAAHRAVADFLVGRGARHHVFSAIALGLEDELRRMAAEDPSALARRQSRHEGRRGALHFAVRRNAPRMAALLLALGADPLDRDADGFTAAAYATAPDADRPVMEALRARGAMDLLAALALRDWEAAARLAPAARERGEGALHLAAKRNDLEAVRWLLERGWDPDARWSHWDARVTPLHLAALFGHDAAAAVLLDAGADPTIRDDLHDSAPAGWAAHAGHTALARRLEARPPG